LALALASVHWALAGSLPMSVLIFDLIHGVSGDMILGALADLGMDLDKWQRALQVSGLPGADIRFAQVNRAGLKATHAIVAEEANPPERHYHELDALLVQAQLPEQVKVQARAVLLRLGQVEAELHAVALDHVHFHEIGALDTLIDIVGACLGFHLLGITVFYTTAFPFGQGTVSMAHGNWPEPVPATAALVKGFPIRFVAEAGEFCTPTGAALVSTLATPLFDSFQGRLLAVGYGAGTRNPPDTPNVLRLCWLAPKGEGQAKEAFQIAHDVLEAYEINCNLDNMTAEHLAFLCESLFEAGALDVWQQSIAMKKGRLGVTVSALCAVSDLSKISEVLARESLTGGFRMHRVQRQVARKTALQLTTSVGPLMAKQIEFPSVARTLPEADAVKAVAKSQGKTWFEVYQSGLAAMASKDEL
jgi:pyridinium-3,5-bisthiocarboxylic acid mononucleotide nickel chelatase